jgi:hypothetical protein
MSQLRFHVALKLSITAVEQATGVMLPSSERHTNGSGAPPPKSHVLGGIVFGF